VKVTPLGDTNILICSGPDSFEDPSDVRFLAGKGAIEHFFLQALHFSPISVIQPVLHTPISFIINTIQFPQLTLFLKDISVSL
jgi:hypothetical protein